MNKPLAKIEVVQAILAPLIWGAGFPATKIAAMNFGPLWTSPIRQLIATLVGLIFLLVIGKGSLGAGISWKWIRIGFLPGFYLALLLALQTVGIQYTTVANCSFITTLYVVFVPIILALRYRQKIEPLIWVIIAVSIFGAVLLCEVDRLQFNIGDAFTLLAAFACALQIIYVGQLSNTIESAAAFNVIQMGWVFVCLLPVAMLAEPFPNLAAQDMTSWWSMLFLAVPSTLIAFAFQINAQKNISAEIASIIFLLEAPFAAVMGWYILDESMTAKQILGAACILVSSVMMILKQASKRAHA